MPDHILIDPDAVLDVAFNWRGTNPWLGVDETISSYTVTVTGATKGATSEADGVVVVWLSAATTAGTVLCHITTNQGRTDDRTMTFIGRHR